MAARRAPPIELSAAHGRCTAPCRRRVSRHARAHRLVPETRQQPWDKVYETPGPLRGRRGRSMTTLIDAVGHGLHHGAGRLNALRGRRASAVPRRCTWTASVSRVLLEPSCLSPYSGTARQAKMTASFCCLTVRVLVVAPKACAGRALASCPVARGRGVGWLGFTAARLRSNVCLCVCVCSCVHVRACMACVRAHTCMHTSVRAGGRMPLFL